MSYADSAALYDDTTFQGRARACICEQATLTYSADPDPANAALASRVIAGNEADIDALTRLVTVAPAGTPVTEDPGLLAATQWAWPQVAQARAGQ